MKRRLLDLIGCPLCAGELDLEVTQEDREGQIITGVLRCAVCAADYPVRGAVPRLVPPDLSVDQRKTADAFGWEWQHFSEMHHQYRDQFLDWIHPLQPEFFAGKLVLDAGCGTGRHATFAAEFGARDVVAMDLSEAVVTAQAHLGGRPNAHVVQGDIYRPPFRRAADGIGPFDLAYSIGVLHHLPDPQRGFDALLPWLKPGGTIFAWVYGHENNAIVRNVVDPIRRRVTTRLPPSLLRVVAWPLAVVLQALAKGVYGPLRRRRIIHRLPMGDYLASLSDFTFRQNYSIVFDHLVAPTAFYLRREEFEAWFRDAALTDVELSWRNRNSWRGRGRTAITNAVDGPAHVSAGQ